MWFSTWVSVFTGVFIGSMAVIRFYGSEEMKHQFLNTLNYIFKKILNIQEPKIEKPEIEE